MQPLHTTTPRPRFSLRFKLMLWMVMFFLVVELSLVLVFQLYQSRSVNAFFDDRIRNSQQQVAEGLRERLPAITDGDLADHSDTLTRMLSQRHLVIEVFDEKGDPVATSHHRRARLPTASWAKVSQSEIPVLLPGPSDAQQSTGEIKTRTAAGWVAAPSGQRFVLLISWSDADAQEMYRRLSGVALVTVPIGVLAMILSAYLIAGIALQPIQAMREMAKSLEPDSLDKVMHVRATGSEIAELEEDLERTRQRLDAAFSAQERFMSNVSHEIKTPIAVLLTEAQTLRLNDTPREVRAFVQSAREEMEKLARMVDSFLLLTRVRHGTGAVPNQEHCLARDILLSSYQDCAAMAAQHAVRVVVRLPDEHHMDVAVYGNCDLLRTAVDNLLRNAIRFSPRERAVELSASADAESLRINVRDYGPGIPPELLPHIFDRFSQAESEQTRGRGHGLGLQIALGITELHGGTITVRNLEEGGCEFEIGLPRSPAHVTDQPQPVTDAASASC